MSKMSKQNISYWFWLPASPSNRFKNFKAFNMNWSC